MNTKKHSLHRCIIDFFSGFKTHLPKYVNFIIKSNDITINNEIENEDKSENRMIDIISEEGKFSKGKSLYEIIYKLKHNTDLNELIFKINQFLKNKFENCFKST